MAEGFGLKKLTMAEIIAEEGNWNKYSVLHDLFLEELSYKKRKCHKIDIWILNDI